MVRTLTLMVLAVTSLACGGGTGRSTPTAPTVVAPPPPPLPTANLVQEGTLRFPECLPITGVCNYRGEGRNTGQGCAQSVRGITRLFNNAGAQIAVDDWSLGGQRVRPNEVFLYGDGFPFTISAVNTPGTYRTEFSWDNVAC